MTLFDDDELVARYTMPEEFKGKVTKGCGYTKSQPRKWTQDEIAYCVSLRNKGLTNEQIGEIVGRTAISIQIKLKRVGKSDDTYNVDHLADKYACNAEFASIINPKDVLDLYCGTRSWWANNGPWMAFTNDMDKNIKADYHEDAAMLIHNLYYRGFTYDVIDLDPYGSAYECFDLAIKMATRGIVITFGEMGHKRWKRLDFVRRYYGIESLDDFTLPRLVQEVERIANRNKKHLVPIISREWDRIARVWFRIEEIKITEMWNNL